MSSFCSIDKKLEKEFPKFYNLLNSDQICSAYLFRGSGKGSTTILVPSDKAIADLEKHKKEEVLDVYKVFGGYVLLKDIYRDDKLDKIPTKNNEITLEVKSKDSKSVTFSNGMKADYVASTRLKKRSSSISIYKITNDITPDEAPKKSGGAFGEVCEEAAKELVCVLSCYKHQQSKMPNIYDKLVEYAVIICDNVSESKKQQLMQLSLGHPYALVMMALSNISGVGLGKDDIEKISGLCNPGDVYKQYISHLSFSPVLSDNFSLSKSTKIEDITSKIESSNLDDVDVKLALCLMEFSFELGMSLDKKESTRSFVESEVKSMVGKIMDKLNSCPKSMMEHGLKHADKEMATMYMLPFADALKKGVGARFIEFLEKENPIDTKLVESRMAYAKRVLC